MNSAAQHQANLKMDEQEIDRLRKQITAFRGAIQDAQAANDDGLMYMMRFPSNCCDHASKFLFLWLFDLGHRNFTWVTAKVGDASHVWLELGGIIIDITADQFPGVTTKVVVDRSSKWHSGLEDVKRCRMGNGTETEEDFFNRTWQIDSVEYIYETIMKYLP